MECEFVTQFLKNVFDWLVEANLIVSQPEEKSLILCNKGLSDIENMIFIAVKYHIYVKRIAMEWLRLEGFISYLKSIYQYEWVIACQNNDMQKHHKRWKHVILCI